jgi:hypothetical protein
MKHVKIFGIVLLGVCFCITSFLSVPPVLAQNANPKKADKKPQLILPVQYYVVAKGKKSTFLSRFCRATQIKLKHTRKTWRAGPFMSAYEAGWLASRIPKACVERILLFSAMKEPPSQDFINAMLGDDYNLDEAKSLETGIIKIGKLNFWRMHLELQSKVQYEAFYLEKDSQPIKVAEMPAIDDPYQDSFGIGLIVKDDAPLFLTVENGPRGTGEKTEDLIAWKFDLSGEKIILDKFDNYTEFLDITDASNHAYADFASSRISIDTKGILLKHFTIEAVATGADADKSLKSATSWQIISPEKDTLRIKHIRKAPGLIWKWP